MAAAEAQHPQAPGRIESVARFCMKMARALHVSGTPTPRLESAIERLSARLGVRCQILTTPTGIQAAFGEGEAQRSFMERVPPGRIDLGRLVRTWEVFEDALAGRCATRDAARRLDELAVARPRWPLPVVVLAFALTAAAAAVFLGGGLGEVLVAAPVGLVIGLFLTTLGDHPRAVGLAEVGSAFVAALLASVLAGLVPDATTRIPTLAGLIVLVPGLSLTIAVSELSRQHLISGSARLVGSAMLFLSLAVGVAFGEVCAALVLGGGAGPVTVVEPLPPWSRWLVLPLAAASFTVIFQARSADGLAILAAGALALTGPWLGSSVMGGAAGAVLGGPEAGLVVPTLGAGIGALLVGLLGNFRSRFRAIPSEVTDLPGILLLVPGVLGYESVSSLLARRTLVGVETATFVLWTATTLVVGLLLSNVLLPPEPPGPRAGRGEERP
ncbi:MAG: threonine/serine exporter family protein [Planctomycetota bacterium]